MDDSTVRIRNSHRKRASHHNAHSRADDDDAMSDLSSSCASSAAPNYSRYYQATTQQEQQQQSNDDDDDDDIVVRDHNQMGILTRIKTQRHRLLGCIAEGTPGLCCFGLESQHEATKMENDKRAKLLLPFPLTNSASLNKEDDGVMAVVWASCDDDSEILVNERSDIQSNINHRDTRTAIVQARDAQRFRDSRERGIAQVGYEKRQYEKKRQQDNNNKKKKEKKTRSTTTATTTSTSQLPLFRSRSLEGLRVIERIQLRSTSSFILNGEKRRSIPVIPIRRSEF